MSWQGDASCVTSSAEQTDTRNVCSHLAAPHAQAFEQVFMAVRVAQLQEVCVLMYFILTVAELQAVPTPL